MSSTAVLLSDTYAPVTGTSLRRRVSLWAPRLAVAATVLLSTIVAFPMASWAGPAMGS
jgi:hypothetical protein